MIAFLEAHIWIVWILAFPISVGFQWIIIGGMAGAWTPRQSYAEYLRASSPPQNP